MTNLVADVRAAVRDHPDATAISVGGTDTTYAEFWAMTGRFAGALRERGFEPGASVALYLPNLPQFVVAFYGVLRAGGTVVPINPQYKAREIRHPLTDSAAVAAVTTHDHVPRIEEIHEHTILRFMVTADGPGQYSTGFSAFLAEGAGAFDDWEVVERADDDVAVLPYTSGTTGRPKGVELTHHNVAANTGAIADLVPEGISADDAALGALPLFHIYGMTVVMNATLTNGGAFYPMAAWDAGAAASLVDDEELTILHGVPAMYNDLVANAGDHDLSSLRLAGAGGSGLPVEVLRAFEETFDATVYEGYGLTETSPVTHFNAPTWGRRAGSVGKPLPDVSARIVDEDFEEVAPVAEGPVDDADLEKVTGEIVVAGPNVMKGYHGLADANEAAFTEADGRRWFHTGDVGYRDEEDYYYVVDRRKDVIVTGGYNVYPREVEELLFEHDGVADVAVVGVPDDRRGETVKAFVVPVPGSDVAADDLVEFCLANLAEYKQPREVEFVEELPRTTTGKVRKFELRERDADASGDGAETDSTDDGGEATLDGGDGTEAEDATDGSADGGGTGDESSEDGTDADGGDDAVTELRDLDGISEGRATTLREAGFDGVEDLRSADRADLTGVDGFGDALVERIKAQVDGDDDERVEDGQTEDA